MMFSLRTLAALSALAPLVIGQSVSSSTNAEINALKTRYYSKSSPTTCACGILEQVVGSNSILFPGSANYTTQNTHYYTTRADLAPACIYVPATVADVAIGVVALDVCQTQFAVRGAGHMVVC